MVRAMFVLDARMLPRVWNLWVQLMTALELSALLLILSAAAFGWVGAIIVGAGLAVAWVFGGMCRLNEEPTAAHAASEGE